MSNPDDIHGFDKGYEAALKRLSEARISERNKQLIRDFVRSSKKKGNKKSTYTNDLNIALRMALFFKKDIDTITEEDFDGLLDHLETKGMVDYNYRKVTKKFFRWLMDENMPTWVRKIHLPHEETPVQPSDLLKKEEIERLLNACTHPRDKALISVILDSAMRIGALGTLKIKNVEFGTFGALLYISRTSQNNKTTPPKPIPLTWSTGFLNQWVSLHPCRSDPEAPLWINLKGQSKHMAMAYNTLRKRLGEIGESAGLKKRLFFHLFRHQKVTDMILKGFNDQQIKFQAGWSPDSDRMLKVYGNFLDEDMIDSIYQQYGLNKSEEKQISLKQCPRCYAVLVPEARACHQCALILDSKLNDEVQEARETLPEVISLLSKDPEFKKRLEEAFKSQ